MTLQVARLDTRARLPTRAHPGDGGLDLYALDAAVLAPGERASIPTGIAVEIAAGHAGLVLLLNTDRRARFELRAGDRIAQLVIVAVALEEVVEVPALSETVRGAGGFGSSGT